MCAFRICCGGLVGEVHCGRRVLLSIRHHRPTREGVYLRHQDQLSPGVHRPRCDLTSVVSKQSNLAKSDSSLLNLQISMLWTDFGLNRCPASHTASDPIIGVSTSAQPRAL